jgi:rare lipoprotein A
MKRLIFISILLFLQCKAAVEEPKEKYNFFAEGNATWYGNSFHGKYTASGELFDTNKLTAAHKTLPFGTVVRVTNLSNNLSVLVRINDRGPVSKSLIIDLSQSAGTEIDILHAGVAKVRLEILELTKQSEE